MLDAVRAAVEANDLLPRARVPLAACPPVPACAAEPVIVGVSGGPDSVALLHVLDRLSRPDGAPAFCLNIAPVAAHLNHSLRGPDADEDRRFVEFLAARLGLPFETARADVAAEAASLGIGLEEAARLARRRFLADVARRRGARFIALGHHADDRAETVLFHILRGTGVEGLASLGPRSTLDMERGGSPHPPRSDIPLPKVGEGGRRPGEGGPADDPLTLPSPTRGEGTRREPTELSLEIVRPLIAVSRDLVLAYLAAEGLEFRHDATNSSRDFTRNRIRADLLPLLRRDYNPKADEALLRLADQAAAAGDVLADALDQAWQAIVRETPAENETRGGSPHPPRTLSSTPTTSPPSVPGSRARSSAGPSNDWAAA